MKEISIRDVNENFVKLFAENWALLTVKNGETANPETCNPMTVSWGAIGEIWGKDSATVYVRQSRYTKHLLDRESHFSLSFFGEKYRNALTFCGSHSGRDTDKIEATGLTPVCDEAAPYFKEARLVIICKKSAAKLLDAESFIDPSIKPDFYADNDLHTIYFGEIEKVLISE